VRRRHKRGCVTFGHFFAIETGAFSFPVNDCAGQDLDDHDGLNCCAAWSRQGPSPYGRQTAPSVCVGEDDDASRQDAEHAVIALERGGLAVAGPVGLEGELCGFAIVEEAGDF